MKSIPMHPGPQWLAMVQPAQPMRTSLNGRMLFISAVSSFTSASEALDEVRKMRERSCYQWNDSVPSSLPDGEIKYRIINNEERIKV